MCRCDVCGREFDCDKEGPGSDCVTFMACDLHSDLDEDGDTEC